MSVRQNTLQDYIDLLYRQAFCGTLVIHFEKGYPEKVTRQEKLKPEDMRRALRRPVYVVKKTEQADGPAETAPKQEEAARGDSEAAL